jgi:predicted glycosyltransferase
MAMRIWIDLANSPHVPFFRALLPEFQRRGHEVEVTTRDFAETVALSRAAGIKNDVVGGHGGKAITGKAGNLINRARALRKWARGRQLDLAVSHNSYSQILAARALRLKSITLMDYEHQPANHLAFRLAARVIVPAGFPEEQLLRYGAHSAKVRRYNGTKEDVYLADFSPDPDFISNLRDLGVEADDILVIVRPPAIEALYHRFENQLFDELLEELSNRPPVKVLLLPRNESQRAKYVRDGKVIVPPVPLDGPNMIAAADLLISAGGTMNREAAAFGTPAATIYMGKWAAVDEQLQQTGRLIRIRSRADFDQLPLRKKGLAKPRRALKVKGQVADLILEGW